MASNRAGVSTERYVRTRTMSQLRLDTSAWLQSFAFPLRMLFGGAKDDADTSGSGRPKRGRSATPDGIPASYRRKAGTKYNTFDLGPIKGEDTGDRGDANDWNRSTLILRSEWSGYRGARLSPRPIAARFGTAPQMAG